MLFADRTSLAVGHHFLTKVNEFLHISKSSSTCNDESDHFIKLPIHVLDKVFGLCAPLDIVHCWEVSGSWRHYLIRRHCWRALHSLLCVPACWREGRSNQRKRRLFDDNEWLLRPDSAAVLSVPMERLRLLELGEFIGMDLLSVRLQRWLNLQERWMKQNYEITTFEQPLSVSNVSSQQLTVTSFAEHANLCFIGVSSHMNGVLVVQFHPYFHRLALLQPDSSSSFQYVQDAPYSAGIWAMATLKCDEDHCNVIPPQCMGKQGGLMSLNTRCYVLAGDVRGSIHCWLVEAGLPMSDSHSVDEEEPPNFTILWSTTLNGVHDRVVRTLASNDRDMFASGGRDGRIFLYSVTDLIGLPRYHKERLCHSYRELKGHQLNHRVHRISFVTRDRLISVGYDGLVIVWHVLTETPLLTINMCQPLYTFAAAKMNLGTNMETASPWAITVCSLKCETHLLLLEPPMINGETGRLWDQRVVYQHNCVPCVLAIVHTQDEAFVGDSDGKIVHIGLTIPRVLHSVQAHSAAVTALKVNSCVLISCGYYPSLRLWNPHNLDLLSTHILDTIQAPIRHLHVTESMILGVGMALGKTNSISFWCMDCSQMKEEKAN